MQGVTSAVKTRSRVDSVDVVRGIVMILMALDHVRDFFGAPGNPTDPARASAALFFTRWITHLCAPTFFLLTGVGAYMMHQRRSTGDVSKFLVTRGLWLIVIELTVFRCLGYQFNVDYQVTLLVILWALGWAMITLGALVHLPLAAIAAFGLTLIAGHNLFDRVNAESLGSFGPLWSILHAPGFFVSTPRFTVFIAYPLIPWIGVTAVGFALGRVFSWEAPARRMFLLRAGLGLTAAFVVLRIANVYGDPVPWTTQSTRVRTLLSFLNANKYPPSLAYLLMTLGPACLLLRLFDRGIPDLLHPVRVLGRVPFFYFMLHMPLIHLLAVVVCLARYGDAHWMFESPSLADYPFTRPPGWGYPLPIVYLIWLSVVLALYPACAWFARVKARNTAAWLSYL
jgi:uncharacterized membrane protein